LIADGRADPAARNSYALRIAAERRYSDVVLTLLWDGRADIAAAWAGVLPGSPAGYGTDTRRIMRFLPRWQRWLRRRAFLRAGAV
jgi:hypothetical protein